MYFENVDDIFERAKKEGAIVIMPLMDAFCRDRYGQFKDLFGHIWEVATHKKDMTNEELESAAKQYFKKNWETRAKEDSLTLVMIATIATTPIKINLHI